MTEQTLTERVVSIARDRRAWIPFAVIGVLLLVLSTMVIVSLETREEPEPEIDEQLAFDRGEATAQTALQSAVSDATAEAGDSPVTNVSFETSAGATLGAANLGSYLDEHDADTFDELTGPEQEDHVFRNYVRLLIYQHADEQFSGVSQDIRGTETRVSLPDIDGDSPNNLTEALQRVDLTVGYESDELGAGKLGVTLDDVQIKVVQDGELIDSRETTVDTTVATTLFELHNRTQRYDELLNMGFFEGLGPALEEGSFTGMGQEMALRLYPLAYAKGFTKYFRPTWFNQTAPGNQMEILTNHAIYALQEQAFGVSDPQSSTEMRIYATCLGLGIVEDQLPAVSQVFNGTTGQVDDEVESALNSVLNNSNLSERIGNIVSNNVNQSLNSVPSSITGAICSELKRSYGDEAEGDISELPTFGDLLGSLQQDEEMQPDEVEVTVETPAALAYREITNGTISPDEGGLVGGPNATDWQRELRLEPLVTTGDEVPNGTEDNGSVEVNESLSGVRDNMLSNFYSSLETDDVDASTDVDNVVGEVYTVEASADAELEDGGDDVAWPDAPSGDDWVLDSEDEDISTDVDVDVGKEYGGLVDPEQTFYEVNISVEQDVERSRTWVCDEDRNENFTLCDPGQSPLERSNQATLTPEMDVALGGEHSPGVAVEHTEERRIEHLYEAGGETGPDEFSASNFDGVPETVLKDAFGLSGVPDTGTVESELAGRLDDIDDEQLDGDDVEFEVGYSSVDDNEYDTLSSDQNETLRDWLETELTRMVYRNISQIGPPGGFPGGSLLNVSTAPSVEPLAVDRKEFLNNESADLLSGLREHVAEAEAAIVYQDLAYDNPGSDKRGYGNLPDLARAELYQQYLDRLNESIDTAQDVRQRQADDGIFGDLLGALGGAAESAADALDGLLGPVLEFADEALGTAFAEDDDEQPAEVDSSLFENVTFEVHGSPTFLEGAASRDRTAAVRPPGEGGRFAGINRSTPLLDGSGNLTMAPPNGTQYSTLYTAYSNPLPYPGLPVIPAFHVAQASMWNVEVGGEYPRFEVSATAGDPSSTTSYVRENRSVEVEIDGERVMVGSVEPLNFDSRTFLGVLVPPGGGVGDGGPAAWTSPSSMLSVFSGCSGTYPTRGPHYDPQDSLIRSILPDSVENVTNFVENTARDINGKIPVVNPIPVNAVTTVEDQLNCIGAQLYGTFEGLFDDGEG